MKKRKSWMKLDGWIYGLMDGGDGAGGRRKKLQSSKLQYPSRRSGQAPSANPKLPGRCPALRPPGGSGDKTSKLRNKPNFKMQESPDFTDVKQRF